MSVSTGVIQIVIKDDGSPSAPSTSRPSGPPQPTQQFANPTIFTPKVEMPSARPVIPEVKPAAVASIDQMIRELLADKGIRKSLGNPTAEEMAKNNPAYIAELYRQVQENTKAAAKEQVDELKKINDTLANGPVFKSPASTEIYGFKDDRDDYATYNVLAAEIRQLPEELKKVMDAAVEQANRPQDPNKPYGTGGGGEGPVVTGGSNPFAPPKEDKSGMGLQSGSVVTDGRNPFAPPRPVAQPISDAEKSREQWSPAGLVGDLKNYLPNSIGKKLGDMQAAYSAASKQAAAGGAGTMGQMAAGASEAMIAAGPVAMLAAAEVGSRVLAGTINKFTHAVDTASTGMQQLAGNDSMGAFKTAVDYTADSLSEIPIVGKVYAAELQAAVAPIRAMHDVTAAFVARGKELAAFSGPLAGANAQAEIRSIMADLREAEQLGPSLARLTDAQSRADSEIRELLLPVKEFVITKLAAAIEIGLEGWNLVKPFFETVGNALFEILDIVKAMSLAYGASNGLAEAIDDWIKESQRGRELDEQLRDRNASFEFMGWLNAADNLGRAPMQMGRNGDDEARRKIAGPVFPGFGF